MTVTVITASRKRPLWRNIAINRFTAISNVRRPTSRSSGVCNICMEKGVVVCLPRTRASLNNFWGTLWISNIDFLSKNRKVQLTWMKYFQFFSWAVSPRRLPQSLSINCYNRFYIYIRVSYCVIIIWSFARQRRVNTFSDNGYARSSGVILWALFFVWFV